MTSALPLRGPVASMWGAIALLIAGLVIGVFNERTFQASRAQVLQAQARVLAATVEPAVVFADAIAARELVGALAADPQVSAAAVYDGRGAPIAMLETPGAQPMPRRGADAVPRQGGRSAAAVAPVTHEGREIGRVYVRSAVQPPLAVVQRHAGVALLLLTAILIVVLAQAAQAEQARAARESRARAAELAELNARLQQQIERRETAEEALRQAQKMETLGQLTGGIAHDFNNLLQTVQGALDIISRNPGDAERVARWSRLGQEAAQRGARVTAQLLAFSRAQKLEIRAVDVRAVIARLRELLPNALGTAVSLHFEVGDGEQTVMADETQLELAVLNLCINARDAMPNGGDVVVSTARISVEGDPELPAGTYLRLSVADTGVGMPQDVRARAFDPFFTTKGVGKGTGLGLAQVYGIARQAGGTARLESATGQGATVTMLLPLAPDAPRAEGEAAVPTPEAVAGARILVVDDDDGVRTFVCEALTAMGYRCIAARDGQSGLEQLAEEPVDLLIVDYAMPGMTGAEFAAAALATRPDLPIIFASGYAESEALDAAMGRPTSLLRKPFDSQTLARRVAEALSAAAVG
ncbi:MAG: response regulator [Phenylobacterium sp.]|uniref:ATP-binding protein n=1 Tax=Phenylobacterium sp. TaxID=1871053 RepID=UPI001A3693B0|nr:ATP-binding protein [Phenylobacterium sp.]MBL8771024.1 response regulator [Phenylobacterium sp.]